MDIAMKVNGKYHKGQGSWWKVVSMNGQILVNSNQFTYRRNAKAKNKSNNVSSNGFTLNV